MRTHLVALLIFLFLFRSPAASAADVVPAASAFKTQGIYLQQYTVQSKRLERLIDKSLDVGINTFVVDLFARQNSYRKAIEHIQERGIRYVPRIVMFADGGNHEQVNSREVWEDRLGLAQYAMDMGAKEIQLDYIRYAVKTSASPQNALDVREVLRFFKQKVNERGAKLQIDVFGEVGYGPSVHIGQDMTLFAPTIDVVCPMVYPSHYRPYEEHVNQPYETVHSSLMGIRRQIGSAPVSVFAYIELFNHRFKLTPEQRVDYIREQLRAVREANAEGWIAWSAGNYYQILFDVMRKYRDEMPPLVATEPSPVRSASIATAPR